MTLEQRIKKMILLPQNRTWVIDSWWIKASAIEDALNETGQCRELDSREPIQMNLFDQLEKEIVK